MVYKKTFKLTAVAIIGLCVARVFMKVLDIDTVTGFYSAGNVWGTVFNAALFLSVGVITLVTLGVDDTSAPAVRHNVVGQVISIGAGLIVAATGLIRTTNALLLDSAIEAVNTMPKFVLVIEGLMGIASGACLIALAIMVFSGSKAPTPVVIIALIPAMWQAIGMVCRFMDFRYVQTASDQLFEIFYMAFATMFFLNFAKCVINIKADRKKCVVYAVDLSVFGTVLCVGQSAAVSVLKTQVAGPSYLRMVVIMTVCVYALFFAFSLCKEENKN